MLNTPDIPAAEIRSQLERVSAGPELENSPRLVELLNYIGEEFLGATWREAFVREAEGVADGGAEEAADECIIIHEYRGKMPLLRQAGPFVVPWRE